MASDNNCPILVPILGDQLTRDLASLRGRTKDDTIILMMEVWDEATYVKHHKQKIALIFSAMRHFAEELRDAGWAVDYTKLTDDENAHSFTGEVARAAERHKPRAIHVVEAGEWRVQQSIEEWPDKFDCEVEIFSDDRFISSIAEFRDWAEGRKTLRMENFYQEMRKKTGLLMEDGKPIGGKWNYDKENREPPKKDMDAPERPKPEPDDITREVIDLVRDKFGDHFGDLDNFHWPVTREEAEDAADAFFAERLPDFGTYQDAMVHGQDDLFHSMLSTSINIGLLDPMELCKRAQLAYDDSTAPLNAVEGFIRQIIGWREYVRGFYWYHMPDLESANALNAQRGLPDFYWTGETDMRCMADCIRSTKENAHAHHIQRLMVLGNFALLAGINPREVQDWYLVVYADAYDWVELPNVAAMILYADGGKLATKPYAASGNYINKMSDYCKECAYSPSKKTGEGACPFNPLYWHFMDRHRDRLESNHRIGRIYSNWDRMDEEKRQDYLDSAEAFLNTLKPAGKS
ncbi:cryptochrome/photolyase family protein [Pontixanthobacter aestiaquae]|uniref:Cryptochrome/photolyase family protein n=1 Tax=Pontixanthobacter aestiaquae TaxID=1509367 RepID=A0A844ZA60_9SPHN|nr:cryptochrome/photolyase family protein [Pontixanthobacter aestiaquae]MDN3644913.1 cryptochrome/photolyase family protein [Pontixanthobacter aestiaquae]MXO84086.1 cryptochrome/photolyase family protein [Pontixanthobacter aestiaquae]